MLSIRIETVEVMYSYTYDDCDDMFERSPLIALVKDLTTTRTYMCVMLFVYVNLC